MAGKIELYELPMIVHISKWCSRRLFKQLSAKYKNGFHNNIFSKGLLFVILCLVSISGLFAQNKKIAVSYISAFQNANNPEIAYWFIDKEMFNEKAWRSKIDSLSAFGKFTMLFLTARDGVNFYDVKNMHPIFKSLVNYAHDKRLKIGLQLWRKEDNVPIEHTERLIQEGEVLLGENGATAYTVNAKHARVVSSILKSELFKVLIFKKTSDGFYDLSTLKDVTAECSSSSTTSSVSVHINLGSIYKGYTAYILTQHYYNFYSNHSEVAGNNLKDILKAYSDIPFDGVGLDEYINLPISPGWELKDGNVFRERTYSLAMAQRFHAAYPDMTLEKTLFNMRFAPDGHPEIRIKAINAYMHCMRTGTMSLEEIIFDYGKKYYGKNTFIGLHDTFHNNIDGDEIWHTGLNWWNIKRDYGHTDEHSPTPIQMGIGMSYPMNVMYNMYYSKSINDIASKALTDLRYGIRTHYHAVNDVQKWGMSVEEPEALEQINKVENCARVLNWFNPSFPKIKLLVLFGMEALANWYPDTVARNKYDLNGKLKIEEKAKLLWDAGYLNALVPTDVIADGRLTIANNGKPTLQGHEFDGIVFLYPEYAKQSTISFLKEYCAKGGKLLTQGNLTFDFNGNNASNEWKKISGSAADTSFSLHAISKLGVERNDLQNGVLNEDGSYTFTDNTSLKTGIPALFSLKQGNNVFSGDFTGVAAIKINSKGDLEKFAATGFTNLKRNGRSIFLLDRAADVYVDGGSKNVKIVIANHGEKRSKIVFKKI